MREWDRVLEFGERWIEGTFFRRARAMGNDIGYDSICAGGSHATTLHWIDNTGAIKPGKLVLLDMGVEGRNLYTADVTRTLPVDGTFTPLQRDLYDLVLAAQQAGIDAVRPGAPFLAAHHAAMEVLAHGLEDLGLLPVLGARRRSTRSRRSTPAGPCTAPRHMLGMDVHDCGRASADIYPKGDLAEGMVLTVEPGLYFQEDDLLVPEELRGIGIRIEDDILVTADGTPNLSAVAPPHLGRRRGVDGPDPPLAFAGMDCHHYDAFRCRSCTLLEVPRSRQLSDKEAHARSLVDAPVWLPTVAGAESGFRNKAKMVVGGTVDAPTLGILDRDLRRRRPA